MTNRILIVLCTISSWIIAIPQAPNKGNYNASSSCFLNAANQALFHIKPFRDFLDEAKNKNYYDQESTAGKFIEYIDLMAKNKNRIDPTSFRKNIAETRIRESIIAMESGQHDSQEYFSYILDDVLNAQGEKQYSDTINNKLKILFELGLEQTITRNTGITKKDEPYWILSLYPNNNNSSLETLIKNRFLSERIEDTNNTIIKNLSIKTLPEVLVVQIIRFSSGIVSLAEKDNAAITFPLYNLDLKPFMLKSSQTEPSIYDLVAIIQHGGGLSSGHYWAYARWGNNWFKYNDLELRPAHYISQETINSIAQQKEEVGYPYLLVYVRKKLENFFIITSKEEASEDESSEYFDFEIHEDLESQLKEIQTKQDDLELRLALAFSRLDELEKRSSEGAEEPKEIRNSLETVQNLLRALKEKLVKLTETITSIASK